jgi:hypothetical protein
VAKYLLLYMGGGNQPQSDAERAAIIQAWTDWFTNLGPAIVDPGNPISPAAKSVASDGTVTDGMPGTPVTGYSVINAESLGAAAALAESCPHLASGGQVAVYETFPVM